MKESETPDAKKSGLFSKVIIIALAGLIGYFVGKGNTEAPLAGAENLQGSVVEKSDSKEPTIITEGQSKTSTPTPPAPQEPAKIDPLMIASEATISIVDQKAGMSATVSNLTVSKTAWIAIRDYKEGVIGKILGARRVAAGSNTNLPVTIFRATEAGKMYVAALYNNDGDSEFEWTKGDAPLLGKDGKQVMMIFTAN